MKKQKVLFIITNINIFSGFFESEIKSISKNFDIYFLISKYGFDNFQFSKIKVQWLNELKKKKIVKEILWLDLVNYSNFYQTIIFNKKLINILNKIKYLEIKYFLFPNRSSYWEEIFFEIFKNKKIYCYLTNPPSGLDLFNNFDMFIKSFNDKKIYQSFEVRSDNQQLHLKNSKELKKNNYIVFFIKKINIFLSKQLNHIWMPLFLINRTIKRNSIFYKLDLSFLKFSKIIIFNQEFKFFLKKLSLDKKIKINYCSKNILEKNKKHDWIFTYASNDKYALNISLKYIIKLKKLNKIDTIYLKGHPTWKHEKIDESFFSLLKKNKIKYKELNPYKNTNYLNFYGLISAPSTVLLESIYNNPKIKIIGIKKNNFLTSGLLFKFYFNYKKNIIWEPSFKNLKKYLQYNNKLNNNHNSLKTLLLQS